MRVSKIFTVVFCVASFATFCVAQSALLDLPRPSQHAVLAQRIGITDITVNYHRPLTNGRKIWGGVVPYGQVWRAGANENTTITFTDPVTIEGKSLPAGSYGLHMIPNENEWTVIFSKNATSWGSFSYKQDEDALRVNVKPQSAELHDALTYDFDQLKPDSAVLTMRWEKVAVPVTIGVNVNEVVEASLQKQLRGRAQYEWQAWDDAANYLVDNKGNLQTALAYSDKAIQNEDRFDDMITKAKVLDAMGQKDQAKVVRDKAMAKATPLQLHIYGRQLQQEKRQDEAFAIFRSNYNKYPDEWFVHSGMARVYTGQGNYDGAVKEMKVAVSKAPDNIKPALEGLVKRLEAKDDINK